MPQGGSSIEDILGSIKRVMARENRELARFQHETLQEEVPSPEEAIGETEQPEPADAEEDEDVLDLSEFGSGDLDAQSVEPLAEADADPAPVGEPDAPDEPLTTEDAAAAMRRSLEALAMVGDPSPRSLRASNTSLESMVRAMLRPMLAQWLEDNLPEIVERHVQAEIARIMSKRG